MYLQSAMCYSFIIWLVNVFYDSLLHLTKWVVEVSFNLQFSRRKNMLQFPPKKRGGKWQTRFQFRRTVRGGKIADAKKLKMKKRVSISVSTHGYYTLQMTISMSWHFSQPLFRETFSDEPRKKALFRATPWQQSLTLAAPREKCQQSHRLQDTHIHMIEASHGWK
jgi:hypothetical protein